MRGGSAKWNVQGFSNFFGETITSERFGKVSAKPSFKTTPKGGTLRCFFFSTSPKSGYPRIFGVGSPFLFVSIN